MQKHGHTLKHDPDDPNNGGIVKLNSFLGIDGREHKKYGYIK